MQLTDITIRTVDPKKLIDYLQIPCEENNEIVIQNFAVFEDRYGIDIDCNFWDLDKHEINKEIQTTVTLECRIKKFNGKGGYSLRMDKADFLRVITLKEYIELSEQMKLTEFIRLNYNPRIEKNQKLLMQYINNKQK